MIEKIPLSVWYCRGLLNKPVDLYGYTYTQHRLFCKNVNKNNISMFKHCLSLLFKSIFDT